MKIAMGCEAGTEALPGRGRWHWIRGRRCRNIVIALLFFAATGPTSVRADPPPDGTLLMYGPFWRVGSLHDPHYGTLPYRIAGDEIAVSTDWTEPMYATDRNENVRGERRLTYRTGAVTGAAARYFDRAGSWGYDVGMRHWWDQLYAGLVFGAYVQDFHPKHKGVKQSQEIGLEFDGSVGAQLPYNMVVLLDAFGGFTNSSGKTRPVISSFTGLDALIAYRF